MSEFGRFYTRTIKSDDPQYTTKRSGFEIHNPLGYVTCFEGYKTDVVDKGTPHERETVEQGVLDLFLVRVVDTSKDGQRGLGTLLVKKAFAEGAKRGFEVARFEVSNPRTASIMEKLVVQGVISATHYVMTEPEFMEPRLQHRTTEDVLNDPHPMSADRAIAYLKSVPVDNNGMTILTDIPRVEGVVRF